MYTKNIALILIFLACVEAQKPCDSDIYCYGNLLHTVQSSEIFNDSKTFVDMSLKHDPQIVQQNFQILFSNERAQISQDSLKTFIENNFNSPGEELKKWFLKDWTPHPKFLVKIQDKQLQIFASQVHGIWRQLGRKIKLNVKNQPDRSSLIYVDNPFIVPGGRFNEFYYWDQFWILKGLLHSEMTQTVRGMLENFFQMVNKFGYVPNGGRIYYQRSQPPLLTPMVNDYLEVTGDFMFLKNHIGTLETEFNFWMRNRSFIVNSKGKNYTVIRYNVEITDPRPESYNEDFSLAENLTDSKSRHELYMNLKTATESGIDFSSRWFVPKNASTTGLLQDCKARFVIPVDLNVLILRNAKLLEKFNKKLGNWNNAIYYSRIAQQWEETINGVFWNETQGSWFDYIFTDERHGHKTDFYPGNVLPLILNLPAMTNKTQRVLQYLRRIGVLNYPGGIPSSLIHSGEQWDFPNAWAPHIHWFVEALEATGYEEARQIAMETAQKWITNNYVTYKMHNGTMFEKYDVNKIGLAGGGGEYDVVAGFGWSNGVLLDLLQKYGKQLRAPSFPFELNNIDATNLNAI